VAAEPGPRQPALVNLLKQAFFFRAWADADLDLLSRIAAVRSYSRDEVLFQQADDCSELLILTRGRVQMYRLQADGREVTLHVVAAPALVACAALFLGGVYPASARVSSPDAEILAVKGKPFLDLLERRPDLARRMIAALSMRIGELADRLESQSADTAPKRLAKWLVDLPRAKGSAAAGHTVRVPVSKKAAAAGLGMTPETFSRMLRRFADSGMIRVERRNIAILDAPRLIEEAGL
jgi:CRP/FNR family transcriptional regulator